jgi:hypothetical protein
MAFVIGLVVSYGIRVANQWDKAVVLRLGRFRALKGPGLTATKKGRCRLHGGASGSGGPPGKRNGQYRHGERTKTAIAERRKLSALLKMLRAGLT